MPNFVLNTSTVGPGIRADMSNDAYAYTVLMPGVVAGSTNDTAIMGTGLSQMVTIYGSAWSGTGYGAVLSGDHANLVVTQGATVNAARAPYSGVVFNGTSPRMVNSGEITGQNGLLLASGAVGARIENHGLIAGAGATTGQVPSGITIGVASEVDTTIYINNTGTISGGAASTDGSSMSGHRMAIYQGEDTPLVAVEIVNAGLLSGEVMLRGGDDSLSNAGLISDAVDMGAGDDRVVNAGQIMGAVLLGAGGDNLDNRNGRITGEINADAGDDTVIGGAMTDEIRGGDDADLIYGLDGDDLIDGELGEDAIHGGAGSDTLSGGSNDDVIHGGSGGDLIDGGSGFDDLRGDSGDDTILGGTAEDTIDGGSGDDNIDGGANADMIFGRSGDDFIRGGTGLDVIEGGAGDDTIAGNSGHDEIDGGSGGDRIFGGANNDTLRGTLGNDYLDGGSDDDLLYGGSDDDRLIGGTGQDMLYGGWGSYAGIWVMA